MSGFCLEPFPHRALMPWHGRFVGEEEGQERKAKADPGLGSDAQCWQGGRPTLRSQASQGHFLLLCPALVGLGDPACDRKLAGEWVGSLYWDQAVFQPSTPHVSAWHPLPPAPCHHGAASSATCPRATEVLPQRIPRESHERARKEFGTKLSL